MLRFFSIGCLLTAAAVVSGVAQAQPAPFLSYDFNAASTGLGGIPDLSGNGNNGTLVDPTGTFGVIAGGQADLSANNGNTSAAANVTADNPIGAYIDLPNGVINDAFASGGNADATIETWFTTSTNRNFARLWDFGTSNGGEDISNGAGDSIYFTPQGGFAAPTGEQPAAFFESRESIFTVPAEVERIFPSVDGDPAVPGPVAAGEEVHVVVAINGNDSITRGGTATIFLNGVQVGTGPLQEFIFTPELAQPLGGPEVANNQWLGRSQFGGDALFDGFYNEFNIYDSALSAGDVLNLFNDGPTAFVGPTAIVNRDTGEITLVNDSGAPVNLSDYTLTSDFGVLDPTQAAAVAGLGGGTSSANEISQSGGSAAIDADGESIGQAWVRSPFEDLALEFTLAGGDTLSAAVVYVGDAIQTSDLNVDGSVDLDDYAIFLANSFATDVAGDTPIDAYFRGDLNNDQAIDVADFLLFKADFLAAGGDAAALAAFSVPEPSAVLLLTAGLSVFGMRRRG